jgi:hypothetical protein
MATTKRKKPGAPAATKSVPRETNPATRPAPVIETWPIERLRPYARNSRTHSDSQIASIVKSIQRFGFTNPILVAETGTILAGHGRTLAAKLMGMAEVPVIVASGWTADERKAYVITDNKIALDAGWDEELLKLELGELAEANFDLSLTGFGEEDLNQLFGTVAGDLATTPPQIKATFQILIECESEAEQLELLTELQGRAVECRALIS